MALLRGDVVLVSYPFSSGAGSKVRPAVVVQPDHNNRRLTNVILAPITTTTHRQNEPTQLFIDPAASGGQGSGLKHASVMTCENLTTVAQSLVRRRLGKLPDATMRQVDACLKAALGLALS